MKPVAEANRYAADLQYKASEENRAMVEKFMEQARADIKPWRDAGLSALDDLTGKIDSGYFTELISERPQWEGFDIDDLEDDPGYQFRMQEQQKVIERQAGALGESRSGATDVALLEHAQGLAGQHMNEAYRRAVTDYGLEVDHWEARQGARMTEHGLLAGMSGTGQLVTAQDLGRRERGTGQMAQWNMQGATARGSGELGAANAMAQGQWMDYQADMSYNQQMMGMLGLGIGAVTGLGGLGWKPFG